MNFQYINRPWEPFEPKGSDPWDLRKVAHLHRRAGFGATWGEIQRDLKAGPAASVDRLLSPPAASADEEQVVESLRQGAVESSNLRRLKAHWLYRMRFGGDPLREKLTLFWHGHFATSITKVASVTAMSRQIETLREHALGDYSKVLAAITSDTAMLSWLDGGTSSKERPNENFAREFLELFTLGTGHYSESDVRESARAFTGWVSGPSRRTPNDANPEFLFDPAHHDDGQKTFLSHSGQWNADDIIRLTLESPEAADFLARKLYRFFVDESKVPSRELIEPLALELRNHDYSIRQVVGIILRSRHFYSQEVYRRRVKSPVELIVGLTRMLEVPRHALSLLTLANACDRQGQSLYGPPSVGGWEGGTSWINSALLLERLNWSNDLIWGHPDSNIAAYDPIAWSQGHGIAPEKIAESLIDVLLDDGLRPEAKAIVLDAAREGRVDDLRKALQRLLHCPEFQLA
ncbi:DUF1800 domain-containing protein [Singulisphaera sp. PoT]|uniref:DUF1800 domain-containing protein n=1 Tax=Singulisphaera sp. PoT TaxID=3411797 RepID=UPI003BF463B4